MGSETARGYLPSLDYLPWWAPHGPWFSTPQPPRLLLRAPPPPDHNHLGLDAARRPRLMDAPPQGYRTNVGICLADPSLTKASPLFACRICPAP
jgi:hypothetical protein